MMEIPKPTEAHQKLQKLVGNWKGEEKIFPSPWDPKGGISQGYIENRSGLGGFIVIQDVKSEKNGEVIFEGHGVFSWDQKQNEYTLHWVDSMGMPLHVFRGDFDKETLTLLHEESEGYARMRVDLSDENRYFLKVDISQDGKNWQPLSEAQYQKA